MLLIRYWKVGCGDAITIQYTDPEGQIRNIFIDGGYKMTYANTVKRRLKEIQVAGQKVALWVVTHTDGDHIGGVEAFRQDPYFNDKENLVDQYWFNWSSYDYLPVGSNISVAQGINLRDDLAKTGKLKTEDIIAGATPVNVHGLELTILSPDQQRLENSKVAWQKEEARQRISSASSDHKTSIEELLQKPFIEDIAPHNGSSIAFLMQYRSRNILMLADSFPSVIIHSLQSLGYGPDNKVQLDTTKLSHHGSRFNFNPELMQYIHCHHFIVLANGMTNSLPDKWTLAQIVTSPHRDEGTIYFHFNDNTPALRSLFTEEDCTKYNFRCLFSDGDYLEHPYND